MTDLPGTAPATADVDPSNFTGPGVTPNPDGGQVQDVGALAQRNAELRAQLLAQNAQLEAALAAGAIAGLASQGLTDEDVRRLEHPDEFEVSNAELHARISELESASGRLSPSTPAPSTTQAWTVPEPYVSNDDGTWTRTADNARGRFGPDGFVAA